MYDFEDVEDTHQRRTLIVKALIDSMDESRYGSQFLPTAVSALSGSIHSATPTIPTGTSESSKVTWNWGMTDEEWRKVDQGYSDLTDTLKKEFQENIDTINQYVDYFANTAKETYTQSTIALLEYYVDGYLLPQLSGTARPFHEQPLEQKKEMFKSFMDIDQTLSYYMNWLDTLGSEKFDVLKGPEELKKKNGMTIIDEIMLKMNYVMVGIIFLYILSTLKRPQKVEEQQTDTEAKKVFDDEMKQTITKFMNRDMDFDSVTTFIQTKGIVINTRFMTTVKNLITLSTNVNSLEGNTLTNRIKLIEKLKTQITTALESGKFEDNEIATFRSDSE